jgi:hypothetical protein
MIEVTIKLIPFGQAEFTRTIGNITIFNDGSSEDPNIGNYTFIATSRDPVDETPIKVTAKILGYPRKSNIFFLLQEVITETLKAVDAPQIGNSFMDYLVKPLKDRKEGNKEE